MATAAAPTIPQTELVSPTRKPQELSFPLPKALHTTGHIHLTFLAHCVMVHLATSTPGDSAGSVKPMGSFVYAMPDVSRPLYSSFISCDRLVVSLLPGNLCWSLFSCMLSSLSFLWAFCYNLLYPCMSSVFKRDICHFYFPSYSSTTSNPLLCSL